MTSTMEETAAAGGADEESNLNSLTGGGEGIAQDDAGKVPDAEESEGEGESKLVREAKDKVMGLSTSGSSVSLLTDLSAELDTRQKELLKRVRKSVHVARGNTPNLRLASSDGGEGMKTVDINDLLGLIEEETVKVEVQKEVLKSKKMVEKISMLLAAEGFF